MTATWLQIALALLKFVNLIMNNIAIERARKAGVDEEIARETVAILQKTQFAQKTLEPFLRNPAAVDDFLRSLEPPDGK